MATTALAAHIVVSKFAWHLPLYRQTQIFAGHGITLDRGTLGIWVTRVAWWLKRRWFDQASGALSQE